MKQNRFFENNSCPAEGDFRLESQTSSISLSDRLSYSAQASGTSEFYTEIMREIDDTPCKLEHENKIRVSPLSGVDFVSTEEVCLHASALAEGKCPVADGIPNEVYKLAYVRLYSLLSIFYSSILCHAFIPTLMSDSVISLILKRSLKNPSESCNYRPISASSAGSKILEMIV